MIRAETHYHHYHPAGFYNHFINQTGTELWCDGPYKSRPIARIIAAETLAALLKLEAEGAAA